MSEWQDAVTFCLHILFTFCLGFTYDIRQGCSSRFRRIFRHTLKMTIMQNTHNSFWEIIDSENSGHFLEGTLKFWDFSGFFSRKIWRLNIDFSKLLPSDWEQFRFLWIVPSPQDSEHFPQAPHCAQTGQNCSKQIFSSLKLPSHFPSVEHFRDLFVIPGPQVFGHGAHSLQSFQTGHKYPESHGVTSILFPFSGFTISGVNLFNQFFRPLTSDKVGECSQRCSNSSHNLPKF